MDRDSIWDLIESHLPDTEEWDFLGLRGFSESLEKAIGEGKVPMHHLYEFYQQELEDSPRQ